MILIDGKINFQVIYLAFLQFHWPFYFIYIYIMQLYFLIINMKSFTWGSLMYCTHDINAQKMQQGDIYLYFYYFVSEQEGRVSFMCRVSPAAHCVCLSPEAAGKLLLDAAHQLSGILSDGCSQCSLTIRNHEGTQGWRRCQDMPLAC